MWLASLSHRHTSHPPLQVDARDPEHPPNNPLRRSVYHTNSYAPRRGRARQFTMSGDPFLEAQSDILSLLNRSRTHLASYLRIRSSASSVNSPELVEARQELESTLTDLTADLQDLVDSVQAVEGDPSRYGLSVQEVRRRRTEEGPEGDQEGES